MREIGLLLDLGRKYWQPEEIKKLIDLMKKVQMTHLQLHLSDVHAFRLESESTLPLEGQAFYTKAEMADIITYAKEKEITLLPDIDSPGHMKALLAARPDFALPETNGEALDVTNPEAVEWMLKIYDEVADLFAGTKTFHIGADEFIYFWSMQQYPYLLEKSRAKYGEDASGLEFYIEYINQLAEHLKARGITARVWNDGLKRHDLHPLVELTREVEICYWTYGTEFDKHIASVQEWLEDGYSLVNYNDYDLYYTLGEISNYHYPTAEKLEKNFFSNKFSLGQYLNEDEMKSVLGTYFSVWADRPEAKEVSEILADLETVLPVFVRKTQEAGKKIEN